jgi:diguanylate cyclase (GGDEF)-like protein/PAS domain S-box-containing protein
MTHLLAELLRHHDPRVIAQVLLEALVGSGTAMRILLRRQPDRVAAVKVTVLFAACVAFCSWLAFLTALSGSYPQLSLVVPARYGLVALAISLGSGLAAGLILQRGRRSARNALLAGSLLSCGFSCMLFTGMAGLVRPFALAYDLTAVLVIMVVGAALCSFAFWEGGSPCRRRPWIIATGLIALAIGLLAFGSLAAILPFDGWMNAMSQPDDLASSPVAIIVAAEAVVVLVLSLFGSLVDNRVAARDRLETDRLRQLADSTLEGILIHADGMILDGNDSLTGLLGIRLAELRGSPVAQFMAPDSDTSLWSGERGSVPAETDILAADGSRLPVEIVSRAISYGGQPAVVTALRDVRERRASEERIRFLAHHDMLTELPNRVLLKESLDLGLRLAARTGTPLAVLCLDLDGFKLVNDTLGHAAGDQLLCQVADRLRGNLRDSDFVARIGGDEFVILQTTGAQPEQATLLARRIIDCMAPAFRIDGQEISVGTSLGIAIHPQDGDTATTLLKHADIALYRAKQNGRGWFCLFESGMDDVLRERREMEKDLRQALARQEFTLDFQPLFDRTRELIAFEALARWHHPERGPVSPGQFIPLAEECGLIIPLGEWVMRTACRAARDWDHDCRVAVNLSPAQFQRGDLQSLVAAVLAETGLAPQRLELEITEGVLMDNADSALAILNGLRSLGVRLVLDDFGTGYSSLSYLHRFPFDKLKVDRSFVQRLEATDSSRAIVSAIISMSRNLNLEVTAEGVETAGQFDLLCAQGCHELQGFLLGRPMPQTAVDTFLVAHRRKPSYAAPAMSPAMP